MLTAYTLRMKDPVAATRPVDRSRMLGQEYWLVRSIPAAGTTAADIEQLVDAHLAWLLGLERTGELLLSGPLVAGSGVGPGSGVTVLRADTEDAARTIAAADPFVRAGLRTFELWRWRLNEGAVTVQLSLGTGRYRWH